MLDRHRSEHSTGRPARDASQVQSLDRRTTPRIPFVAEAQVLEMVSGMKIRGRSCDLAINGCYVDTLNPFPVGAQVRIRLRQEQTILDAKGKVVYGLTGLGMGISFMDLAPEQLATVEAWLTAETQEEHEFDSSPAPMETQEGAHPRRIAGQPAVQMADLIAMLAHKGILSRAEAALLLGEPLD